MDKITPDFKGLISSVINMKDIVANIVNQIQPTEDVIRHSLPKDSTQLSGETKYLVTIPTSILRPANTNTSSEMMTRESATILSFTKTDTAEFQAPA